MNDRELCNKNVLTETVSPQITQYRTIIRELNQHRRLSEAIVHKILNSRRLLIDHVESLENSIYELELGFSKFDVLTLLNVSILGSASLLLNVTGNVIKPVKLGSATIAGTFGLLYFYKCFRRIQNKAALERIDRLIHLIEIFGNGIKKNMSYFNELLVMNSGKVVIEDIHYKRSWGCIQAIKTVTEMLFDATRQLEANYPLLSCFRDMYTPMEDLSTCHYFTKQLIEFNPQHIKDFYNIFAYVQSQFLLRLGLAVAQDSTISFLQADLVRLTTQIHKITTDEEYNFLRISSTLKRKSIPQRSELQKLDFKQRHYAPTAILKDTSLKLTSSIIAVAEECEKLDLTLNEIIGEDDIENSALYPEKKERIFNLGETIRSVELALSTCNDDFQRLMLIYNKFIGNRITNTLEVGKTTKSSDPKENYEHLQALSLPDVEITGSQGDDYFAYAYDDHATQPDADDQDYEKYTDYELHNLDQRVTKKHFRPVLQQLKTKIDPIREDMLRNERRVLEAKGVNIDKFFGPNLGDGDRTRHSSETDSESNGSDRSIEQKERPIRVDHYGELRDFLARKVPVNLYNLPRPPSSSMFTEEDIIE